MQHELGCQRLNCGLLTITGHLLPRITSSESLAFIGNAGPRERRFRRRSVLKISALRRE